MKSYRQFKREALKDKQLAKAYYALEPSYELITYLMKRRIEKGFTQRQLAERLGTKQSAIARLESGTYNPSVGFVSRIADALGAKLTLTARG